VALPRRDNAHPSITIHDLGADHPGVLSFQKTFICMSPVENGTSEIRSHEAVMKGRA